MSAPLLIISDRPALFANVELPGREIFRFRPADAPDAYAAVAADEPDLLVVVDTERAGAVLRAVHDANAGAAALVLDGGALKGRPPEGMIVEALGWSAFLRTDLGTELHRLETRRHMARLHRFAEGVRVLPILLQNDPDPDGMASALALQTLLRRSGTEAPVITLGRVSRPENRRMAELLQLAVTTVTESELRAFDRIVTVDVQPVELKSLTPRVAVVDHHPPAGGYHAESADIRPGYGATSTILTEYLRVDDERKIKGRLATALLYGIKTDTASLSRGATPADVTAYAFLQGRADVALLQRIERPGYDIHLARAFGEALGHLVMDGDLVVAVMAELGPDDTHVLASLADFLLSLEGARWSAAGAIVEGKLMIKLRYVGAEPGAGALARRLARGDEVGGGGHAAMAQVICEVQGCPDVVAALQRGDEASATRALAQRISAEVDALRPQHEAAGAGKNRRAVSGAPTDDD